MPAFARPKREDTAALGQPPRDKGKTPGLAPASEARKLIPADTLAVNIVRQLEACAPSDRWAMVHAIRGHSLEAVPERVELSLHALRACLSETERLSRGTYDRWRESHQDEDAWPSSEFVRNTFGSWSRAQAAAGETALLDTLASNLTTDTLAFSREEVIANLREYGELGLPLRFVDYRRWADDRMATPDRAQSRYIRSGVTINRLFGTWTAALVAAGLGPRLAANSKRLAVRGSSADYSDAECARSLRAAASELGEVPTKAAYNGWAQSCRTRHLDAGDFVSVPAAATIVARIGSWASALLAADLISEREHKQRAGHRTTFIPDGELLAALREALGQADELTEADYERFRRSVAPRRLPSSKLIRSRLGGWPAARRAALERDGGTARDG